MFLGVDPASGRLDAVNGDGFVVEERLEQAHGVGAATDTGYEGVGQPALGA